MRTISLLTLLLLHAMGSWAQGLDIRGVVADSATGERIPHANITVRGTTRGASTNLSGFYLITNLPFGTYELVASAVGYRTEVRKIVVRGREPVVVNFKMSQRTVEFSEIIVESERVVEKLDAASIHVLGEQEILDVPSAGPQDVFRSLTLLPGIISTSDVSSKFYVRGGAGDQNLILLDGMRIYNPFHAFGVYSVFDPDIINSAEVFTGAFPAGYGNRLSSVVNLTTKQGNSSRLAGRAEANFLSGKLMLEGPIKGGNSWLVSGRTSLSDRGLKHFLRNPSPVSFYDAFLKATIGSETGRNSFRGFISGDDITSPNPEEPDHSWRSHALAVSLSGLAYERIYVDGVVYSSSFKIRRDTKQSNVIFPAESRVGDDGMRVDFTIHTESSGVFMAGFQFDLPDYEFKFTTNANTQRTFQSTDTEIWLWLRHQQNFQILQTDFGVHMDVVSLASKGPSLQALQPRASVALRLADLWRMRFSFGVYNQRVITISNEDDITSLFEAWISIPDPLRPEESHHYVLGLEGLLTDDLSMDLQAYYKHYPSLVLYNREKYFPEDPDYINGKGKAYGAELLARFGSSLLDVYASYSIGWTQVTTGGFTYAPRYDRRHSVNTLGVLHPLANLDVAIRWEFGSGYPFTQTIGYYDRLLLSGLGSGPWYGETGLPYSILGEKNAARLPDYYRLDASVTYHFTFEPLRGSIGLNLANFTNRKNILFYDRKTGQKVYMLDFFPSATLRIEY